MKRGEGERKRNSSALKERTREGCMKSTARERAEKRGSDPAEECHSAEDRGLQTGWAQQCLDGAWVRF